MSLRRAAAIVGVAESDLGIVGDRTVLQLQAQAACAALEDAGLTPADVDGLACAAFSGSWGPTLVLGEYLGIQPRYTDSNNLGGASFESHLGHAAAAIQAGLCDTVLIVYGSTQRSQKERSLAGFRPALQDQWETPFGLPRPAGSYALAAMRHMHQYGTTPQQLAEVAVAARGWASLNPRAFMREPLTVADVLASPPICDPLHRLDCCVVTDGGGAVVVTSPERARDCRKPPVWLLGHGECHTHFNINQMDDFTQIAAGPSSRAAFAMAGVTPADIDVVQTYDSFTITVILALEAMGFCPLGEGGAFVSGGRIAPGGTFPLNTSGGGLSYCHPGMFGIFLLIEAVRQLRSECGDRQVPNAELALCNGVGGVLSTAATCILGRD